LAPFEKKVTAAKKFIKDILDDHTDSDQQSLASAITADIRGITVDDELDPAILLNDSLNAFETYSIMTDGDVFDECFIEIFGGPVVTFTPSQEKSQKTLNTYIFSTCFPSTLTC
jgi:hypothetical protein